MENTTNTHIYRESTLLLQTTKHALLRFFTSFFHLQARSWTCSFCDEHQYSWTDHRSISLESLEDVEITGFRGADEDMDLVRLLFASSTNSIESMTLDNITKTCGTGTVSLKRMTADQDGNAWHGDD